MVLYTHNTPQKMETADLVTFTEEILNGKLHFLCCATFITLRLEEQNISQCFWTRHQHYRYVISVLTTEQGLTVKKSVINFKFSFYLVLLMHCGF